jgi:hypothetical protein
MQATGIALAAFSLIACGSAPSRIRVTATGQVGPLRVDRSDRADVIAFAGKPEAERRGSYDGAAPFDALGYGCGRKQATDSLGFPTCRTVFYVDLRDGELELFFTTDARYADTHDIHVGTATAVAERAFHRRVVVGCDALLVVRTKSAFLVTRFEGGKAVRALGKRHELHLVGGHVAFVVAHSGRHNPGVLDCIDS